MGKRSITKNICGNDNIKCNIVLKTDGEFMQTRIRLKEKLEELRYERGLTLEQLEEQTQIG